MARRLNPPQTQPDGSAVSGIGQSVSESISWMVNNWYWFVLAILGIAVFVLIQYIRAKADEEENPHEDNYFKTSDRCSENVDDYTQNVYLYNENGLTFLGEYLGECFTLDGFFNIKYQTRKFKGLLFKWLYVTPFINIIAEFFAYDVHILKLNENKVWYEPKKNSRGEIDFKDDGTLKNPIKHELTHSLWKRDRKNIIVHALDVEKLGFFEYPVLRDKKGNIVDMSHEVYQRVSSPMYFDLMVDQTKRYATQMSRDVELDKKFVAKQQANTENIRSEDLRGENEQV